MSTRLSIYTIGHSDHATADFVGLLREHRITLVVDVRSQPYSRWAPQFNRETLEQALEESGIGYEFLGHALGGRAADPGLYTGGRPDYGRMEEVEAYQRGIEHLTEAAGTERVVIMCGEGDYRECHRHLLITQTLLKRGVEVLHIKPDGQLIAGERVAEQLSLF